MIERGAFRSARWRYVFISGLLASVSALPVRAATAETDTTAAGPSTAVGEVIVTATKREENLQNVAVSVQALTPTILSQHQVASSDDYIKLLPSVSFQSFGPGQSQIYFRGITSGGDGLHIGSEPATGVYVDEVPLTTIANGVDLHVYDMARVEALSGPQGTLFGASSLSGTLRLITNQPDPTHFSASADAQLDAFTDGGPGGMVQGYVNIPVSDKVAIRLVAFDEHDAGYINNVPKTRVFNLTPGSDPATGDTLTENNSRFTKNNFNDVDTYGGRVALRVDLNDSWSITPAVIAQHQKSDGNFLQNPKLGDLNIADFGPDLNIDDWYLASMTIKGKIANWDVLYAGGWFGRTVNNKTDYSYYAVGYDALGYTSLVTYPDGHGGFLDPDQQFTSNDQYTKQSHEFRVSSPGDQPLRFLGGLFYERQTNLSTSNYIIPGLLASGDLDSAGNPAAVPGAGDDLFYKHLNRVDRDFALFGELAWDIRPNLTLTLGGRYFTANNTLLGFSGFSHNAADPTTCFASTAITQVPCVNVNAQVKESGETHKLNLSWKIQPQLMVYATYSTGFRPGGVNRLALAPPYQPDTVDNYEVGWKTTWLDGRLRFNGAVFDEEWHGLQYGYAPLGGAGVTIIVNAGDARSYGVEGDVAFRATDQLTLTLSGTALHAALTKQFCSTSDCAPSGTRLPVQPDYKLNASARYEFEVHDFKSFFEGDLGAQGESTSALFRHDEASLGPTQPFATLDLSAGFGRDNWTFTVFAQNIADTRGVLSVNVDCTITACGPDALQYLTKPRFVGAKISAKFD
ncbi:MAG TPA: TonB-dependent receptor [Caulobacteraceae bacterium]|nr:TonB-dependent receptor [Caulobacteraceae bacterium]